MSAGALQPAYGGGARDCFITRLALAGGGAADLVYSTYLGGSDNEGLAGSLEIKVMGLDTDGSGIVYVTGRTA